tara:strand:+ start:303 stop:500 length:198 start_codon:yes stop_codon:yes gene_type:complete
MLKKNDRIFHDGRIGLVMHNQAIGGPSKDSVEIRLTTNSWKEMEDAPGEFGNFTVPVSSVTKVDC